MKTAHGAVHGGSHFRTRHVGYLGPSELSAHFGVGAAPVVDELQVHWADGSTSTYHQVPTTAPSPSRRASSDANG